MKNSNIKKPGLYGPVAAGVGVLAVICVIVGYNALKPKSTSTVTTTTKTTTTTTTTKPALSYDGTYTGNGNAVEGLTGATVNVANGKMSGPATYKGTFAGRTNSVAVSVTGTVSATGLVKGTFSGSGTIMGQPVTVSGTVGGQITGKSMNCSWGATVAGQKTNGNIVLNKI